MNDLQNKYKRFREWKLHPHQVAPLSEEQHECATCGTHYEGNYCPRCGQSARIGYSYVSTVWRLLAALIPFVILCLLVAFAGIVIIVYSID